MVNLAFIVALVLLNTLSLDAAERAASPYWATPKFFVVNYTHLYGDGRDSARKKWKESLKKLREHNVDGIIAVVPQKFFAEGCQREDIAEVCQAYLDECADAGVDCVLSMGALEGENSEEQQSIWAQTSPVSTTLNAIGRACAQAVALKGYILHVEPVYDDADLYVQSCKALVNSLRKEDKNTTVFIKGLRSDLHQISVVKRIDAAHVLPAANVFAYRESYSMQNFKEDCDGVKDDFCFISVGHNAKRFCDDSAQSRAQFYTDAIKYGAQRGWSVAVWGYEGKEPTALDETSLQAVKAAIVAVRKERACVASP